MTTWNGPILVIDDDANVTDAIAAYFRRRGMTVHCAAELEEAEALLMVRRYAAVITDVRMTAYPGTEGIQLLDFVRGTCPDTPVVVLTGNRSDEVLDAAQRLGAAAVLEKPQPLASLANLITTLLEGDAPCQLN
jgi:DNA-binding NtrC family response regulator